eukprot:5420260-Pleurochrysis_carterae.AAC.1
MPVGRGSGLAIKGHARRTVLSVSKLFTGSCGWTERDEENGYSGACGDVLKGQGGCLGHCYTGGRSNGCGDGHVGCVSFAWQPRVFKSLSLRYRSLHRRRNLEVERVITGTEVRGRRTNKEECGLKLERSEEGRVKGKGTCLGIRLLLRYTALLGQKEGA